ncbi:hypothetical protein GFE25_23045 [Salmonella enterica]|uniref:Uncharacterized protein n=1 Tax=Salmonella enterica TaxID=28901 RepID=A0A639WLS4_SALER|nr:hypothetical protein [Salmonella enterica]
MIYSSEIWYFPLTRCQRVTVKSCPRQSTACFLAGLYCGLNTIRCVPSPESAPSSAINVASAATYSAPSIRTGRPKRAAVTSSILVLRRSKGLAIEPYRHRFLPFCRRRPGHTHQRQSAGGIQLHLTVFQIHFFSRRHHIGGQFGDQENAVGDAVPGGACRNIGDSDDEHIAGLHQAATLYCSGGRNGERGARLYIILCHNDFLRSSHE